MGDNDRKRKHGRWNQKVKQKSVEAGATGLFFTCEGHEKTALQEAYSIIDELLDDSSNGISTLPVAEKSDKTEETKEKKAEESEEEEEDLADALKKACDNERQPVKSAKFFKKERRCIQRPTGVKNCIFVSVKNANISLLAEKMVDLTQKAPRCRFLQRVIPVEHSFAVNLKQLSDIIMEAVSKNMKVKENGNYPSYSVEFKARNNDSVQKNSVLEMVDDAMNAFAPSARANLNHADVTFYIQISRTTAMVGVCREFYARRKYSMRPTKPTTE